MLSLIGVWIFFMRQIAGRRRKALSFGKARSALISEKQNKITFQDVAGVDEARKSFAEIIDFLKDPQKFQKLAARSPRACSSSPPGTGRRFWQKAIAEKGTFPFFSISGSDFVEMFVGVGASRVRDLLEQGKKGTRLHHLHGRDRRGGRHRGAGLGGGTTEREQTLNQLLVEMDGFETNEGVILIAPRTGPMSSIRAAAARPFRPAGGGARPT